MTCAAQVKAGSTIPLVFTVKDKCSWEVIPLLGTDTIELLIQRKTGTVYSESTSGANLALYTDGSDGKLILTPPDSSYFATAEAGTWNLDGTITRSGEVIPIYAASFTVLPTLSV